MSITRASAEFAFILGRETKGTYRYVVQLEFPNESYDKMLIHAKNRDAAKSLLEQHVRTKIKLVKTGAMCWLCILEHNPTNTKVLFARV